VQSGERQLHLGLAFTGTDRPAVGDVGGQMVQEGGLADAGFPPYHEDGAPAASNLGHQIVHDLAFTIASKHLAHPAPRERH
jgi:hypothetical protein